MIVGTLYCCVIELRCRHTASFSDTTEIRFSVVCGRLNFESFCCTKWQFSLTSILCDNLVECICRNLNGEQRKRSYVALEML